MGMNALNKNKKFRQSLLLYEKYAKLNDDVTHLLALRATQNLNDYDKGLEIHKSVKSKSPCIELQNALISFYGYFGQISKAQTMYDSMIKRDDATNNTMMTVLINHNLFEQALSFYDCVQSKSQILHILALKVCTK